MEPLGYTIRVRLKKANVFFGPGVACLLNLVEQTGSLQTAAGTMEMSYSKAWKIVRAAEQEMGFPFLVRQVGGTGGGSSQLTEQGKAFVQQYERFQQAVADAAEQLFAAEFGGEQTDEVD